MNRAPINITLTPMIVYISKDSENVTTVPSITGHILLIDPDEHEEFTIIFDKPTIRALIPTSSYFSLILDDGSTVYVSECSCLSTAANDLFTSQAQMYNITVVDMHPPSGRDNLDYSTNVTANITDSHNHSLLYQFSIRYLSKSANNATDFSIIVPTTTAVNSAGLKNPFRSKVSIRIKELSENLRYSLNDISKVLRTCHSSKHFTFGIVLGWNIVSSIAYSSL
jgi:hypothetical protein